jgi:hypothetical protein
MRPRKTSASKERHAQLIAENPDAWSRIRGAVATIKITCEPEKLEQEVVALQKLLYPGLHARDYIRVTSPGSHGVKYDTIVVLTPDVRGAAWKLDINLITYKQEEGFAQIGARHLAERLITEGIIPRSLAERAKEKGYGA